MLRTPAGQREASCLQNDAGRSWGAGPEDRARRPGGEPPRVRKGSGGGRRGRDVGAPRGLPACASPNAPACGVLEAQEAKGRRAGGRGAGHGGAGGTSVCSSRPGALQEAWGRELVPSGPPAFPSSGQKGRGVSAGPGAVAWPCCPMGRSLASLGRPDPDPDPCRWSCLCVPWSRACVAPMATGGGHVAGAWGCLCPPLPKAPSGALSLCHCYCGRLCAPGPSPSGRLLAGPPAPAWGIVSPLAPVPSVPRNGAGPGRSPQGPVFSPGFAG